LLNSGDKIEKFIYPCPFRIFEGEKMIFEILAFIIGLIYGYVKPGKEKRWELFKKGILYGIILGIIFGFIGLFIGGVVYSAASAIGMFITVIILVVIFIIGTFIGDILEVAIKK
jgi:predicted permease